MNLCTTRCVLCGVIAWISLLTGAPAGPLDRTVTQWTPYVQWAVESPNRTKNPFDTVATVTFRHEATGARHVTEMFYAGGTTWKFRFTGTATGTWRFTTTSDDRNLDGRSGTVTVTANPDPQAHGFVTALKQKWCWQGTNKAFVPQLCMYAGIPKIFGDEAQLKRDVDVFLRGHGFNGFHIPVIGGRWFAYDRADERVTADMKNPDPRTFAALERAITTVHAAGGFIHIWAWGDQQRRWTPYSLAGGPQGDVDRRLQRYIAARLGPIPGWTMGYGFDLQEWAAVPGRRNLVKPWHDFLCARLGWPHLLGGRMGPTIRGGSRDHRAQAALNRGLGYYGYEHHRPTYEVYVACLEALPGRPVMSEDRFRIRVPPRYPDKDYNEELTRHGLYHSTMAGGVANIWGTNTPGGWRPGGGSRVYPHPHIIKTYASFFRSRFLNDMERAPGLGDAVALKTPDNTHFVFYKEATDAISMHLAAMHGTQPAIAVDTKKVYAEFRVGLLPPGDHTWRAPYRSDWIIAVGRY